MLRTELSDALKQAMKSRDQRTVSTLRLILAALKDRDIQARSSGNSEGIPREEILQMLQKMVKQRNEAIELYRQGERQDLVDKECEEIAVIKRFLPKPLSAEETNQAVTDAIEEVGAESVKDIGRVMGVLKQRYTGRMDFALAGRLTKAALT
jgi:uncharacterized protein YqeY